MNSLAVGGSETKIIRIANALASSGTRVRLAYLNPPETGLEKISSDVSVTHLHRRGKYSIGALRKLRRLIDDESRLVASVSLYPLLYVVPAVRGPKARNVKTVAFVNTSVVTGRVALFARGYAAFLRQCDHTVFGCKAQRRQWTGTYGLPLRRSSVIYNGVDYEAYSPGVAAEEGASLRRQLDIPADTLVIGSVGRLAPEKNFDLLISVLARLKRAGRNACLVLVGTGGEQERLEQLAADEGVRDSVRFPGLLDDVRPALSIMDVFVLPSRAVETFSNAALEAMAMARAVVLSDIGGAAEMLEDGKSGLLFPVGNVDTLTGILNQLHDRRDKRRALGEAARARVVTCFGFAEMVAQYKALLPR